MRLLFESLCVVALLPLLLVLVILALVLYCVMAPKR